MTTKPSIILVVGILALALISSCQSAQKSTEQNQEGTLTPASSNAAETRPSMQKTTGGATTMPVSSPSSPYTEDRLHDLEKGLRRLQSLPSMTKPSKTATRSRKQRL